MTDIAVRAVMTGDQSGLVGAARASTAEVDKLTAAAQRATAAGRAHGNVVEINTRQVTQLSYAARHLAEELAAGVPITNILATQALHLSAAFSSVGEAAALLTRVLPFAAAAGGVAAIAGLTAAAIASAVAHEDMAKKIEELSTNSMPALVATATKLHDEYGAINDLALAYVKLGPSVIDMTDKIAESQKKAAEKARDSGWWTMLAMGNTAASSTPEALEYQRQAALHPELVTPRIKLNQGKAIPLELDASDTASSAPAESYQDRYGAEALKQQFLDKEKEADWAHPDKAIAALYAEQTNAIRYGFKPNAMPLLNAYDAFNPANPNPGLAHSLRIEDERKTDEEISKIKEDAAQRDAETAQEFADRVIRANAAMADNIRQSFEDMGASVIVDFGHMGDAVKRFVQQLATIALQRNILGPLSNDLLGAPGTTFGGSLGGFFSDLFGMGGTEAGVGSAEQLASLGIYHTGGILGADMMARRFVHPAHFDHAPRFHDGGLLPGEQSDHRRNRAKASSRRSRWTMPTNCCSRRCSVRTST
jgi:hypothetical protein